ncbi:MAG TPA: hypothetical protein VF435_06170 [Pyrinomonadaceae bacterium]
MKKKKTKPAKSAKRFPRPPVLIITAIAVVAIAAVTVVSRQSAPGIEATKTNEPTTAASGPADEKYTKVKVAGQDVSVNQTGQVKPLSPEEAQKLADSLKHLLNKSTEGLVEERHADGSGSVDLQGRFEHVTVARKNQDGSVSQSCVDNPRAAAAFYKIDPKLLESDQPTVKKPVSKPVNN